MEDGVFESLIQEDAGANKAREDFLRNELRGYEEQLSALLDHTAPESWYNARLVVSTNLVRSLGGFATLSKEWIRPLAKWIGNRKVLEILGGCGSLSKCLHDEGVDIRCTDTKSWATKPATLFHRWQEEWFPAEALDAVSAVQKYGKDVDFVLMSWPFMDETAFNVAKEIAKSNPNLRIIYIGEGEGDCCASSSFFNAVVKNDDAEFVRIAKSYKTAFANMHDRLVLYDVCI